MSDREFTRKTLTNLLIAAQKSRVHPTTARRPPAILAEILWRRYHPEVNETRPAIGKTWQVNGETIRTLEGEALRLLRGYFRGHHFFPTKLSVPPRNILPSWLYVRVFGENQGAEEARYES